MQMNNNLCTVWSVKDVQPETHRKPVYFWQISGGSEVFNIAKILLYKEDGRNLYYVNIVFHNNLVLGNALLHKKKCQQ